MNNIDNNRNRRNDMSLETKLELLGKIKKEENQNQRYLANKFSLSLVFVNKLLKLDEGTINPKDAKKIRNSNLYKTAELEPLLLEWFTEVRHRNITVSAQVIMNQAIYFA
ncbi:hypothetical protein DMUE_2914 [Dictyocoela muelleri]|nr:hypothetical protein DMUE_2914 [Dictyocoela muelleri]